MKIYISCDIEGLAGIADWSMEKEDTANFRELYHKHLAWVLEGIRQSAINDLIEEITISDAHSKGTNLSYLRLSEMDERVSLVSGFPRMDYMMSGLDSSYDLVLFAGYHGGIGKQYASMDHGYSSKVAYRLEINGKYMNETTINAAYASELGVPVGLVIGESGLKEQLIDEQMMPWVSYVSTKESLARYGVKTRPMREVRREIIQQTKKVLDSDFSAIPLYKIQMPAKVELCCTTTAQADRLEMLSGVERLDGRKVRFTCGTMQETMNQIVAAVGLGGTAY